MSVEIEVLGLRVFGRHGVLEHERRDGQWFALDVTLALADVPHGDAVDATVDYRDVVTAVREVVEGERVRLLETLAAAVADRLLDRFAAVTSARVRVGKPELALDADGTPRVTVERRR